jgi:2-oxoisovalerate dehydrogenase E2 component (dihydrolipoyl transacylase)
VTAKVFLLPDLGEGLTEGEIVSWSVAVGDVVEVDQIIAVIETAKAAVDLPCPYAGTVLTLHGAEGEVLDVGAPLITIETQAPASAGASDSGPAPTTASATETESAEDASGNVLIGYGTSGAPARRRRTSSAIASEPQAPEVSSKPGSRVRVISPLVRRLAAEHGVDLRTLTPSGPKGIILRADVEAAITATNTPTNTAANTAPRAAAASTAPAGSTIPAVGDVTVPMTLGQRTMAERLAVSRRDIPDATTWVDVDATGLMAMRTDLAAAWPEAGIGVLALLGRIVVAGLRRFPELNARADVAAGTLTRFADVHLSFAAQGPRGLVVPVVHGAGSMTTAELATALRDLTARARAGQLSPAELGGGTFTLNNYGGYGVDGSTPIINHPESGMLGVGRIIDKPWVVDGQLAVRKVTQLSLTFDHRVCDGAVAGGFLRFVADCVERPGILVGAL